MGARTYSTAEVAVKIGVSRQTLYAWIEGGFIDAPEPVVAGNGSIRVWTDRHLRSAREFKGTLKPGPKAKAVTK